LSDDLADLEATLVLDADGLNRLAAGGEASAWLRRRRGPTWITPHQAEFARLFPELTTLPPLEAAAAAADRSGAWVLLKGARSLVAAPSGERWQLAQASPWAARAGLGDVLAGYAGGLAALGRAACEGLIAGGVLPVIKHIPGHGRAMADSHLALPVVEAPYADLDTWDFEPFRVLSDMPMAMSAHVIYAAVDPRRPGTTSRRVLRRVVREAIGFDGLLMTDDLSMKALTGDFTQRAKDSLAAGCDIVLHCNGDMAEMQGVIAGTRTLSGRSAQRARAALGRLARTPEPFDAEEGRARFDAAFGGQWA
jgi:hypothetical protein